MMRQLRVLIILHILSGSAVVGQTQQTAVPYISEVTPPSLPPATTTPGNGTFTLTILGANFPGNAVVNLIGPANNVVHPVSTTVNATGSQISAQFSSAVLPSPATLQITVTNPNIGPPSTSNPFFLPETPSTPGVVVNQNVGEPLSSQLSGFVISDFTGDGMPGVAILSPSVDTVTILQSNFGGPFSTIASYPTGSQPTAIVAADFQGGGIPGLAVTNGRDNTVSIFFANGGGTFRSGPTVALPYVYPTQVIAADFNGDGKIDLAVLNTCGTGASGCLPSGLPREPGLITILLGNGDGTFTVTPTVAKTGFAPFFMAAADLNGDGVLDLVVSNSTDNTLTVLMGNGDGTFTPTTTSPQTGFSPQGIAIGDFNGDGKLDIAVANGYQGTVSILLNQDCPANAPADCTFAATADSPAVGSRPNSVATGDLNADGSLDLVVGNYGDNTVSVLLGDGTGAFRTVSPNFPGAFSTGSFPAQMGLSDFNQDGRLDIFAVAEDGTYSVIQQSAVGQVVLTSNNTLPSYGTAVNLTATLNPPFGQLQPTGSFSFYDGNTAIGNVPLNGYQALLQYPGLSAGTHQITAVYSGDLNFVSVTSNGVSEIVGQAPTSLALTSNVTYINYGQSVTLTANIQQQNLGTATGSIVFTDTFSGNTTLGSVNLANNAAPLTLSNLLPGTHVILASYAGDANYFGSASSSLTVNVSQATTTLTITANPNPSSYGQSVTLSGSVHTSSGSNPSGTITFAEGSTILGSAAVSGGSGQVILSNLSTGTHVITGSYSGDAQFTGSSSSLLAETVNAASATTTLSSNVNPVTFNQNVTFTANVQTQSNGTLTGSLTFLDGNISLGTVTLSANGAQISLSTLSAGSHAISAKYSGDANFAASTSAIVNETVSQATTATTLTATANPASYEQTVTFTATVQPQAGGAVTGNISFYDGASSLGSAPISSNSAQLSVSTLATGAHSITVKYSGDSNFAAGTSSTVVETINPASTTVTVSANSNPSSFGQTLVVTAAVSAARGTPTGAVTFYDSGTALGSSSVSGGSAVLPVSSLTAGSHSITARYGGDGNFSASTSAAVTQTVNSATTSIALSSGTNPSSYKQSVTFLATVRPPYGGTPSGTVTFFDGNTSLGSVGLSGGWAQLALSNFTVGSHSITAKYNGDANFNASTSSGLTQTVSVGATSTLLYLNVNPSSYGQAVSFSAVVTPAYGGSPTGSVTFLDGSTLLGSAILSGGTASLSIPGKTLSAGSNAISAQYSGDATFAASTATAQSQSVNTAATSTTVGSNLNPSVSGQSVTFTAHVSSTISGTLSGSMNFFVDGNSNPVASVTVSGGSASYSSNALSGGSHTITATFASTNANFGGSSGSLTQTVKDFSVSISPASQTFNLSSSGTYALTVTPLGGFMGSVSLGCNGAPASVTCKVSTGSVSLTGTDSAQATITITVGQHAAAGTYTLTAKGVSGSLTHLAPFTVVLN